MISVFTGCRGGFFLGEKAANTFQFFSSGTKPKDTNFLSINAVKKIKIDILGHMSRLIREYGPCTGRIEDTVYPNANDGVKIMKITEIRDRIKKRVRDLIEEYTRNI